MTVEVVADDVQDEVDVDGARWAELARLALLDEGQSGELMVSFVDRDEIATLNAEYMGKSGPTDVLAFPLDANSEDAELSGGPRLIGDLVICPAVARDQAHEHAGTLDDELALLVVHGVLHLVGHDHAEPDETARMRARELELLSAHHWHGPAPSAFRQSH